MGGVAERIHDRREIIGYLRTEFDDVGLRDGDILGKATVLAHDTDRDRVLAHVPHTTAAVTAMPTDNMSFRRDTFADLKITDTRTYFSDHSDELMSHRIGRFAVGLRPRIPFIHMQVGTADSSLDHLDQHVVDAYLGHRHLFHPDTGFRVFLY